jgi:hypothetical protein
VRPSNPKNLKAEPLEPCVTINHLSPNQKARSLMPFSPFRLLVDPPIVSQTVSLITGASLAKRTGSLNG